MTEPTLEEMVKDYDRHMSWYVPTINRLQKEWHKNRSSARKCENMSTQYEMKLVPPDKDGKIPVKRGDKIWWLNGIPYRFDITVSTKG